MADKKNMTRAQALQFAINFITTVDADAEVTDPVAKEAIEVLDKMHEQLTKPRAKAVTKARKGNEALADKVAKLVADNHDTAVTTKDVVALGIPEITTTQKAAAVLRVACELGRFEKVIDGKKVGYKKVVTE